MTAIFASISSQLRILYALLLREVKIRFRDSPIGPLSAVVEPLGFMLIMTFIFSNIRMRSVDLGEYLFLFFMTGLLPLFCFKNVMNGIGSTINKHRRTMYAPNIGPLDLIFTCYLFAIIVYIALFASINWFFVIVYGYVGAEYFVLCLIPMLCNALIGIGFGVLITVGSIFFRYLTTITGILFGPIQLLSGMFFTAETLPPQILPILWWNPFFHSTELFRTYYYYEYNSEMFDPYYYYGWVIAAFFIGIATERLMRHRLLAQAG